MQQKTPISPCIGFVRSDFSGGLDVYIRADDAVNFAVFLLEGPDAGCYTVTVRVR